MFCRSISWFICIFVPVAIATGYSSGDSNTESSTADPVQGAGPSTGADLGALLDAGEGAVVALVAGGTRLAAHRAVLAARSAVFQRALLDSSTGEVPVPGVEGPELRQLLACLYTLQAPRLRTDCEQQQRQRAESSAADRVEEAGPSTGADLGALLDAGEGAVVTLVAGDTRLAAHRAVLAARSPVFASTLQRAGTGEVAVPDVEGPVLRQLVAYLYTLRAPRLPGAALQLLAAADRYGLSDLKADCEQQVIAQLSAETAPAAAALAHRHSSETLKKAAMDFIRSHIFHVVAKQGWADAVNSSRAPADRGQTPATAAPATAAQTNAPTTDVSLLRSLSPEEKGRRLIEAAKQGAVGELEALLAAEADVRMAEEDGSGWTALHWAADRGHVGAVWRLLAAGAAVDARSAARWTPLHEAARQGHAAAAWLLLAAGADPGARTAGGWAPLHLAAYWGRRQAAAALLEAGADPAPRDHEGQTPLDLARGRGHRRLLRLLRGDSA